MRHNILHLTATNKKYTKEDFDHISIDFSHLKRMNR